MPPTHTAKQGHVQTRKERGEEIQRRRNELFKLDKEIREKEKEKRSLEEALSMLTIKSSSGFKPAGRGRITKDQKNLAEALSNFTLKSSKSNFNRKSRKKSRKKSCMQQEKHGEWKSVYEAILLAREARKNLNRAIELFKECKKESINCEQLEENIKNKENELRHLLADIAELQNIY